MWLTISSKPSTPSLLAKVRGRGVPEGGGRGLEVVVVGKVREDEEETRRRTFVAGLKRDTRGAGRGLLCPG